MQSVMREPARICRGCWDQMRVPIPIRGALALPFRACGITRSKMNPNICTICERSFSYVKKQRQITADATILFADMRGYTHLSETIGASALSQRVRIFHDECAQAVWAHDGIVNKQMGDGLMAIFNFPIRNKDHAAAALAAAIAIQERCLTAFADAARDGGRLGVGVGVHTGEVEIGEFSTFRSDFTAIGGTVNLAARLESQAAPGEILVSEEAAARASAAVSGAEERLLTLKGIDQPVSTFVLRPDGVPAGGRLAS